MGITAFSPILTKSDIKKCYYKKQKKEIKDKENISYQVKTTINLTLF